MTDYDISLLLDGPTSGRMWQKTRRGINNELLHGAAFVDEYRGKQVPAGKKSLTMRLTIGSPEKTLTSAEIEEVRLRRAQEARQAPGCGAAPPINSRHFFPFTVPGK